MSEPSFSLIVALPGEEPVAHELQGDAITFGRSPENQIQVLIAEVSVRHGQIVRDDAGYRLVDPGSTNGTRVNGQPVGPEGVVLNPMDRILLGTVVPAYYVPSSMLAGNSAAQLIATIEASAPPARVKTAPVATAAPATGVRAAVPLAPAAAAPSGPATVKLDQVRAPAPGGVRPAPVPTAPRQPLAPPAGAPAAAPAPAPLRPPGVAPVAPPKAPGVPAAVPVRPGVAPAAVAPAKPAPGVIPVKPVSGASTVPIKRVAPSAPTIPLPKKPGE